MTTTEKRLLRAARWAAWIFERTGWTWAGGESAYVPSADAIARAYRDLAEHSRAADGRAVSSGRLLVEDGPDGPDFYLELSGDL